jgi:AraC-like DNA-binding protein
MDPMSLLRNALVLDADGCATDRHRLVETRDFDEIRVWSDQVYMPYQVRPLDKALKPDSRLDAAEVGCLILSRFSYGIPVHLSEFSSGPGMGMVLTTIRGAARHWVDVDSPADTGIGDTFLVDTARTDYWADFDPDHLQLNVTFPHNFLENLYERWTGRPPEDSMWMRKIRFGGLQSSWMALLEYVCRCVAENPAQVSGGVLGRHLEELVGMHLLMQWTQQCGIDVNDTRRTLAPRYVKQAEQYLRDHAREAPTLSRIAAAVGVSVRALTGAFRDFRGTTPMAFLREQRLQGVRADLLAAPPGVTVTTVAQLWGYCNMGLFAGAYRRRFGELPSQTLRRLRTRT